MSDFFQLVEQRESCRNYDPQKRPTKEQLVRCIQAAQLSPSACNSQPWSFLVINSPEKAAVVAASTQCAGFNKFTDNCPSFIAVCEEDAYLMGDPQHPNQKYADIDLGIAVAHLCYAAKQQGLSTCITWVPLTKRCSWRVWASPKRNGSAWSSRSAMLPTTSFALKSASRSSRS